MKSGALQSSVCFPFILHIFVTIYEYRSGGGREPPWGLDKHHSFVRKFGGLHSCWQGLNFKIQNKIKGSLHVQGLFTNLQIKNYLFTCFTPDPAGCPLACPLLRPLCDFQSLATDHNTVWSANIIKITYHMPALIQIREKYKFGKMSITAKLIIYYDSLNGLFKTSKRFRGKN